MRWWIRIQAMQMEILLRCHLANLFKGEEKFVNMNTCPTVWLIGNTINYPLNVKAETKTELSKTVHLQGTAHYCVSGGGHTGLKLFDYNLEVAFDFTDFAPWSFYWSVRIIIKQWTGSRHGYGINWPGAPPCTGELQQGFHHEYCSLSRSLCVTSLGRKEPKINGPREVVLIVMVILGWH